MSNDPMTPGPDIPSGSLPDSLMDEADLARMRPMALAKRARLVCGLNQADFAARYGLPLGTLRDWEQQRVQPDAAAIAYLTAILNDPEAVAAAYNKSAA